MFPDVMVDAAKFLIVLGVINVIYGAIVTLRQTDMKRLVAFSSISHMGYVLVGISSVAGRRGSSVARGTDRRRHADVHARDDNGPHVPDGRPCL